MLQHALHSLPVKGQRVAYLRPPTDACILPLCLQAGGSRTGCVDVGPAVLGLLPSVCAACSWEGYMQPQTSLGWAPGLPGVSLFAWQRMLCSSAAARLIEGRLKPASRTAADAPPGTPEPWCIGKEGLDLPPEGHVEQQEEVAGNEETGYGACKCGEQQ